MAVSEMRAKLDDRLKAIERAFGELEARKEAIAKQRAGLDRQLAEIAHEQLRLDGEYRGLKGICSDAAPDKEN